MDAIDRHSPTHILRFHKCKVTSLLIDYNHSGSEIPVLISGDEQGVIAQWNLLTRRPIVTFTLSAEVQIVCIHSIDDKLVVLSKDHTLRMYTGQSITFEMKVNTLNFANFEIFHNGADKMYTMISCNTSISENFDIYIFDDGSLNSLKRIFNSVSMMKFIEEHSLLGDEFKKLGILMKIARNDITNEIICGFESGIVIGFTLHTDTFDKFDESGYIEVQFISKFHYPNPILDIALDSQTGEVVTTSTGKRIELIKLSNGTKDVVGTNCDDYFVDNSQRIVMSKDVWCEGYTSSLIDVQYDNIGHIDVTSNSFICATWSGKTIVLDRQTTSDKYVFWTSRSHVTVSESSQGNIDPNRNKISDRKGSFEKVGSLTSFDPTQFQSLETGSSNKLKPISAGHSRRLEQFVHQPWCIIGYESGTIAMYKI